VPVSTGGAGKKNSDVSGYAASGDDFEIFERLASACRSAAFWFADGAGKTSSPTPQETYPRTRPRTLTRLYERSKSPGLEKLW
jgi:hypothetical protein